jgi:hypothetical protein
VSDAQTPSSAPEKRYWWVAVIVVPIVVALIALIGRQGPTPPQPGSVGTLVWILPIVGFILGAGVASRIVGEIGSLLPTPVLVLFAIFGFGFAIWAAASANSDQANPVPVMIFLAGSGISMLAFGIGCYWRDLRLGTYIGCCAAVVATVFLIIWETGSSGGWVTEAGRISAEPAPFHISYAGLVALGLIFSVPNVLAWISLALAGLGVVLTVVLDFSGKEGSESSPIGLGVFLAAVITVHFALRGDDVEDLPDWVHSSLVRLRSLWGVVLMALGILGLATNETNSGYIGAALGIGLLALLVDFFTGSGLFRRKRF